MQCIKYFNKTFILSLISCFYLHNENSYHISITSTLANSSSLSRNVVAQISLNLSRSKLNIALLRTSNDVVVLFLKMIKQWLHSYESKDYLIFKSNYTKSMNYYIMIMTSFNAIPSIFCMLQNKITISYFNCC